MPATLPERLLRVGSTWIKELLVGMLSKLKPSNLVIIMKDKGRHIKSMPTDREGDPNVLYWGQCGRLGIVGAKGAEGRVHFVCDLV